MLNHIPIQNSPAGPTCSQHLPPRLCTQPPDLPITKLHGRTRRGWSRIGHVWHWLARNEQEGAAMSDGIWAILQGQNYTATLKISQTLLFLQFFAMDPEWSKPGLVGPDPSEAKKCENMIRFMDHLNHINMFLRKTAKREKLLVWSGLQSFNMEPWIFVLGLKRRSCWSFFDILGGVGEENGLGCGIRRWLWPFLTLFGWAPGGWTWQSGESVWDPTWIDLDSYYWRINGCKHSWTLYHTLPKMNTTWAGGIDAQTH